MKKVNIAGKDFELEDRDLALILALKEIASQLRLKND